jgi:hypothetical protein
VEIGMNARRLECRHHMLHQNHDHQHQRQQLRTLLIAATTAIEALQLRLQLLKLARAQLTTAPATTVIIIIISSSSSTIHTPPSISSAKIRKTNSLVIGFCRRQGSFRPIEFRQRLRLALTHLHKLPCARCAAASGCLIRGSISAITSRVVI